jgi:hypothetical protein
LDENGDPFEDEFFIIFENKNNLLKLNCKEIDLNFTAYDDKSVNHFVLASEKLEKLKLKQTMISNAIIRLKKKI